MVYILIEVLDGSFSVCQVTDFSEIDCNRDFSFTGKTDEECSLVCLTEDVPEQVLKREDGWRGFRLQGELDFSLIGILAKITTFLAEHDIPVFVLSTFRTDYILVKEEKFERALGVLEDAGYQLQEGKEE